LLAREKSSAAKDMTILDLLILLAANNNLVLLFSAIQLQPNQNKLLKYVRHKTRVRKTDNDNKPQSV